MADNGIVKQMLMSNNYWVLNKDLVKLFGLEAAFLLSNFAEAETLMADDDGWFYQTSETVEKMTTLSRHKQDQAVIVLEKSGVLEKTVKGLPPKRYFRIDYECLTNLFVKNQQINMRKIDKSICEKSATNKEHIDKEHIDKEHSNKDIEKKAPRKKHGEYNHILLTEDQYNKLLNDFGPQRLSEVIKRMDEWIQLKGKGYKDYNLAIRKWLKDEKTVPQQNQKKSEFTNYEQRETNYKDLEKSLLGLEE